VLHCDGPFEAAQAWNVDAPPAGRRGRDRCAGRPRSSRSRRGPWRSPAARRRGHGPRRGRDRAARALDRVGLTTPAGRR
jgi:hypothetical protein